MLQRILNFVIGQYYHTNKESTYRVGHKTCVTPSSAKVNVYERNDANNEHSVVSVEHVPTKNYNHYNL
jgi:hypothetical protein